MEKIEQVHNIEEKQKAARFVLEQLQEWFGIEAAREEYIAESEQQIFFAAKVNEETVGFLCLKETGKATLELAVMGVLPEYHRQGIGRRLFMSARDYAVEGGYSFLQVKTVQMGKYANYDKTNQFYLSLGFKEFEVFPNLWDEWNPCQIYVMAL